MWHVNFVADADGYNLSETDEMMVTDTLAEDTLPNFTSAGGSEAGRWINWGLKRLSKESVCRSSAFVQGFQV